MTWPFGKLRMFGYGAILADPPWKYRMYGPGGYTKAPEHQYETMDDDAIYALPVHDLAQKDCVLFLWAAFPRLPLAMEVMKRWGFRYVTGGAWVKRTKSGKLRWGTGYWLRSACEPFLIGCIGDIQAKPGNIVNIIESVAREHSRKPPEARQIVEKMTPHAFRCELFAREPWPDNETWGDEQGKFQ